MRSSKQVRPMEKFLVQTQLLHKIGGMSYRVYIVRCSDGTYYTGQTTDLQKRILAHDRGRGARYTRGRGPVQLVYQAGVESLREAFILERKIKRMSRTAKERLIQTAQTEKTSSLRKTKSVARRQGR